MNDKTQHQQQHNDNNNTNNNNKQNKTEYLFILSVTSLSFYK